MTTLKFLQMSGCLQVKRVSKSKRSTAHTATMKNTVCETKVSCKNPSGALCSLLLLRRPRALCFYQDLCCWISASDPSSLLCVRQAANSESTCVLRSQKRHRVNGREGASWEKEFELCFTSGARSPGFVWEEPSACAVWQISGGEDRTWRLDHDTHSKAVLQVLSL